MLGLATLMLAGCGSDSKAPKLAPVTGTVTLNGQLVTGGTVAFIPDNNQQTTGPQSVGTIDENGKYTVSAPGGKVGAVVGHHKVTVTCPPDPGMTSAASGTERPKSGARCNVPKRYAGMKTTPLKVEVKAGTNDIPLKLTTGR